RSVLELPIINWEWYECLIGFVLAGAAVSLVVMLIIHQTGNLRSNEDQQIINERTLFVKSSETCELLKKVGGCHYNPEFAPDRLTVVIYGVKPQFQHKFAQQFIATRDLVVQAKHLGFRELTITSGGLSAEVDETYDLTTDPVSRK